MDLLPRKIGVYGGSFNPPHIGHYLAVCYAHSMHDLDEVWVIPCHTHPYGKDLVEFSHRVQMCKLMFQRHRDVKVLEVEEQLEKPNFTYRTLEHIKECYPHLELYLMVGQDCSSDMDTWDGIERTRAATEGVVVVPRSGYDSEGHLLPEISSTELRETLKQSGSVDRHIALAVRQHIESNGLYV